MRKSWIEVELSEVSEVNPRAEIRPTNNFLVQFVPMKLVDEMVNNIHLIETRKFFEVYKKGYTYFEENDILFAKVTPCMENGKIAVAKNIKNGIGYGSSEFHVIRCSEILNNKYLFFFFLRSKFRTDAKHAMTGAVGLRRVPKSFIEECLIPLPCFLEQKAIVKKIESLFRLIDQSKKELEKTKERVKIFRQAILKKAFDGELTRDWREKKASKDNKWVKKIIKEIALNIQYGYTQSASIKKIGPKFLRITDIQNDCVHWGNVPFCKISNKEMEKYLLKKGDLVFARTGATVGKSFLISGDIPKSVYASYLIRIGFLQEVIKEYVYYYFQSPFYWNAIKENQVGTGQPNVNGTRLSNLEIPFPPTLEQKAIVKKIESLFSFCDKLEKHIDKSIKDINTLRQSILKKAFEGKLLNDKELEECRKSPDWKSGKELLEEIKKKKDSNNTKEKLKKRKKAV